MGAAFEGEVIAKLRGGVVHAPCSADVEGAGVGVGSEGEPSGGHAFLPFRMQCVVVGVGAGGGHLNAEPAGVGAGSGDAEVGAERSLIGGPFNEEVPTAVGDVGDFEGRLERELRFEGDFAWVDGSRRLVELAGPECDVIGVRDGENIRRDRIGELERCPVAGGDEFSLHEFRRV